MSQVSAESKKSAPDGRLGPPTAAAGGGDLLGEVARGVGQRGPGKRSQDFVRKLANAYGMLPGDVLAATVMDGLPEHLAAGGLPGEWLQTRARTLAKALGCKIPEAMGMLLGVVRELMPYAHQKQPMAIDINERSIAFIVQADAQAGAPGRRDLRPADVREKPMISGLGDARSDADGRMTDASALKTQEE